MSLGLSFLRTPAQQEHEFVAVAPVVQPVSGAEADPEFRDTLPDAPVVSEVAKLHPVDARLDAGARL